MNPWMWIVWALAVFVIMFVLSAAVAGAIDAWKKPKPCEKCGHVKGQAT